MLLLQAIIYLFIVATTEFGHVNGNADMYPRYPQYGRDWIYFPTENGVPKILFLGYQSRESERIFRDINNAVTFTLYTKNNMNDGQVLTFDNETLRNSNIDLEKETKFVTHGWFSSGNSSTCIEIKNNYLKYYDFNVIIVDWSPIADSVFYPAPMYETNDVAEHYTKFVKFLISHGLKTEKLHLIGHSLGAHISGFVGDMLGNQTVQRITGLDPAQPGFVTNILTRGKISKNNAKFVDIIHSCGGVLGLYEALGHVDFYPNGGTPPQPGCQGLPQIAEGCSHGRSWKYFAESIIPDAVFVARKCSSWFSFLGNFCTNDTAFMGDRVSENAEGSFYLMTKSDEPFAFYDATTNDV